jgi:hypothetical protein
MIFILRVQNTVNLICVSQQQSFCIKKITDKLILMEKFEINLIE